VPPRAGEFAAELPGGGRGVVGVQEGFARRGSR